MPDQPTISVEFSTDYESANIILERREIWEKERCDGMPEVADVGMVIAHSKGSRLLLVRNEKGIIGFFLMVALGRSMYEQHNCFLEGHRGYAMLTAACMAHELMFVATDCTIGTGLCPDWVPEARIAAAKQGIRAWTVERAIQRDGRWFGGVAYILTWHMWLVRYANQPDTLRIGRALWGNTEPPVQAGEWAMLSRCFAHGQADKGLEMFNTMQRLRKRPVWRAVNLTDAGGGWQFEAGDGAIAFCNDGLGVVNYLPAGESPDNPFLETPKTALALQTA